MPSVYYPSSFEDAAILVIDAIGEIESTSFYHAKCNKIKKILVSEDKYLIRVS